MTDGTQRSSEQKLKGSSPSEDSLCKLSMCFEEVPLQSHCSSKGSECFSTGGIRQNTPPTPGVPKEQREKSLRETEVLQPQRMTENCQESLGCNSIRVKETTREKHQEPRPSVQTQLSCYSGVDETTLWETEYG